MQPFDQETAARVWQRVHQDPPPGPDMQQLPELIRRARLDAATYLQLSRQMQGKERAAMQEMFRQKRSHSACLKGIFTLLNGKSPELEPITLPQQRVCAALRRCYGSAMQNLAAYESYRTDPQYGPAFVRLAQQEQALCMQLLSLIGKLSGK